MAMAICATLIRMLNASDGHPVRGRLLGVFLLVTVLLGGGAAWLDRPGHRADLAAVGGSLILYMLILAAAVRFFHLALFEGTLLLALLSSSTLPSRSWLAGLGYPLTRAGARWQRNTASSTRPADALAARQDAAT